MKFVNYILSNSFHIHLLLAALLFYPVLEKKDKFIIKCIIFLCVYLIFPFFGLYEWNWLQIGWFNFSYIIVFGMLLLCLWCCFKMSFVEILFFGIASYVIQHTADCTARILITLIAPLLGDRTSFDVQLYMFIFHLFEIAAMVVVYPISYKLFSKRLISGEEIHLKKTSLIALLIVAILCIYVCSMYSFTKSDSWIPIKIYDFAFCVTVLFLQFSLFDKSKAEIKNEQLGKIIELNATHYEDLKQNIDIINRKCHDLKYQIRDIRKNRGVVDGKYLKELEHSVMIYDLIVKSGNSALDVIITEKSLLCEECGIVVASVIDGSALDFIDDADIYSLFGNIFDNAIYALRKVEDEQRRVININIAVKGELLVIHQDNYYSGEIELKDGLPVTTKDKSIHGYGVSSINYIAQKYGGNLSVLAENNLFELNIIIPIKK